MFDGDLPSITDTPPDDGGQIFWYLNGGESGGGSNGPIGTCDIQVTLTDGVQHQYLLQPDRSNVMSYFSIEPLHFSADQIHTVRDVLVQMANRKHLLGPALRWSGWQEVQPGGGLTDAALAATAFDGNLYLLDKGVQDVQNRVFFNAALPGQPFTGWQEVQPGGGLTDAAPAATDFDGHLWVFVRGADDLILGNAARTGEPFSGWWEVPGGMRTDAPPALATFDGSLYVFVREQGTGRIVVNKCMPA